MIFFLFISLYFKVANFSPILHYYMFETNNFLHLKLS